MSNADPVRQGRYWKSVDDARRLVMLRGLSGRRVKLRDVSRSFYVIRRLRWLVLRLCNRTRLVQPSRCIYDVNTDTISERPCRCERLSQSSSKIELSQKPVKKGLAMSLLMTVRVAHITSPSLHFSRLVHVVVSQYFNCSLSYSTSKANVSKLSIRSSKPYTERA